MKIFDFNIQSGIYSFEFSELNTTLHSHPVVEIINATKGNFSLETNETSEENLIFAIIDSNIPHKIIAQDGTFEILMIESYNNTLAEFLHQEDITMKSGIFSKTVFIAKNKLFSEIKKMTSIESLKTSTDDRVNKAINFIEDNEVEYKNLIPTLTTSLFLSNSRLSHLFKEQIGVSIKKYLVWSRLKKAIHLYLREQTNLTDVSLESGFFDQAHLSNSFKNILGVNPSKVYNSRILQS